MDPLSVADQATLEWSDPETMKNTLAEFVDILNLYGPDSKEVKEFHTKYSNDSEFLRICNIAIETQKLLKSGNLQ